MSMASSVSGLLVFIDDDPAKLIGRHFVVQMDNDTKHTAKATQEFLKVWNILQWPSQSPDLNPIEHAFHLLKTKLKAERHTNKQQLKSAAVKTWQSITKEETQSLVMSMSSRLKAVIACKGVAESVPLAPYSGHQREPSPEY